MDRLLAIHPRTLNQEATADGPICWILLIPTTSALMEEFLAGKIGERELLNRTTPGGSYEAIYLCSALVLPEHRSAGVARRVSVEAIRAIAAEHPIRRLFYWPFSPEGERLAAAGAPACDLPLMHRSRGHGA